MHKQHWIVTEGRWGTFGKGMQSSNPVSQMGGSVSPNQLITNCLNYSQPVVLPGTFRDHWFVYLLWSSLILRPLSFIPTCFQVEGPGWYRIGNPQVCVVSQREADLDRPPDLELLTTRVQQDADGCHRPQFDAPEHCKGVKNINSKSKTLALSYC